MQLQHLLYLSLCALSFAGDSACALQRPISCSVRQDPGSPCGWPLLLVGWEKSLALLLARVQCTMQPESIWNTLNTMCRVDVLDQSDLVTCRRALSGDDRAVCEEVLPDLKVKIRQLWSRNLGVAKKSIAAYPVPSHAVLANDLIPVADPVSVPSPQCSRVVHADGIEALDFEASTLELVDEEAEWSGSVSAREDVLVHEQTPDQILVLPRLTETSDLQKEDSIIVEHVVDLREESTKVANTNVLSHFETGNLLVATFRNRNVAVVHAENAALLLWDSDLS